MRQKNMRLIDADDVVESLKNWFIMNRHYHPYSKSNLIPATEVIDIIDRSPTIEERKTGKWEEVDDMWDDSVYKCSACYGMFTLIEGTPQDNDMNYCPYYGAKMEGEEGRSDDADTN